jgi:hypothetical protein
MVDEAGRLAQGEKLTLSDLKKIIPKKAGISSVKSSI